MSCVFGVCGVDLYRMDIIYYLFVPVKYGVLWLCWIVLMIGGVTDVNMLNVDDGPFFDKHLFKAVDVRNILGELSENDLSILSDVTQERLEMTHMAPDTTFDDVPDNEMEEGLDIPPEDEGRVPEDREHLEYISRFDKFVDGLADLYVFYF